MDATFAISGMHCGRCLGRIKQALAPFAGVVDVTISPQRAILSDIRDETTLEHLRQAVSAAGPYTIEPLQGFEATAPTVTAETDDPGLSAYWPLFIIVGYIAVASIAGAGAGGETRLEAWMLNFMAGFFLVFSAFKFLDLEGFADAYASYDLLASRWKGYGYVYPFLELALGLAYLFRYELHATHLATVALMGFSSVGVIHALSQRRKLQCACLGTALKLPMSTITLVEDAGMAAMAAAMLLV